VPKQDRVDELLEVLVNIDAAVSTVVLYRNARLRGARFARRTAANYLYDLHERGHAKKVDPEALERRELIVVESETSGYWMPTEAGREYVRSA